MGNLYLLFNSSVNLKLLQKIKTVSEKLYVTYMSQEKSDSFSSALEFWEVSTCFTVKFGVKVTGEQCHREGNNQQQLTSSD